MIRKPLLALFAAGLSASALADYQEVRALSLAARGVDTVSIQSGAGSLDVIGVPGAGDITVTATIEISGQSDERAREVIATDMVLSLLKDSDRAELKAWIDDGWGTGQSSHIHLEVRMPEGLHLEVDDGSGSIDIGNVRGDIMLEDGSGSLDMRDVGGNVEIEDGSGSISVSGVGGDLAINDGSGSITVRDVRGSVTVDDGSGSIDVRNVEEDLVIVDDGSGGLDFSQIGGRVDKES
jgi:DUF4097 and DUF4098 domain-containing protein YvlB